MSILKVNKYIEELYKTNNLEDEKILYILDNLNSENREFLIKKANETRLKFYGNKVYIRGLIEFSNYCIKNCLYCGIRCSNKYAHRYRLSLDEIMTSVKTGDKLGYKTFVLQSGEDPYFDDNKMIEIIKNIKKECPNSAITLSLGEKSYDSYEKMFKAGANRYLLRHETANNELYNRFHPDASFENRRKCLLNLRKIGYEIGAGFMVGLPFQKNEHLVQDLRYIKELNPHMCGIGPFIPHKDTELKNECSGTVEKTIVMLALIRLLSPKILLPATTALGTLDKFGREKGIKAGANVIMPNLSPIEVRNKYLLYNNKAYTNGESAECKLEIENSLKSIGFEIDESIGNSKIKD
ncbi:[FeFe] hydrogenase H-cluster radical SAM maturase HydE [Clostridium ihumii]|uniref:[FeFe] hydrogenase H-cluster radical SAM maturase HydE n=1 Tax=Clostridium ihumii TaxID=1470356 RepID=UPI00058D9611|nr:[FeFe] hydrogenase H-cluster radical SAM maturase HydE [Clostridium ihumii]